MNIRLTHVGTPTRRRDRAPVGEASRAPLDDGLGVGASSAVGEAPRRIVAHERGAAGHPLPGAIAPRSVDAGPAGRLSVASVERPGTPRTPRAM